MAGATVSSVVRVFLHCPKPSVSVFFLLPFRPPSHASPAFPCSFLLRVKKGTVVIVNFDSKVLLF